MIEVLIRFLSDKDDVDEKVKAFNKIYDVNNGLFFKVFSLFGVIFTFMFFMISIMLAIGLIFFSFSGEVPEDPRKYFIAGSVGLLGVSVVFFKLMKKSWRKLKQPIEKELELEL